MTFVLIAHRGFSSDAPENTFAAFDLALEHGFDHIETDVQLTSDRVPVILHDCNLDRTTSGSGRVSDSTAAYVRSLDAGLWFRGEGSSVGRRGPAAYGDCFVPTLEEVLQRYQGRATLHLELKSREQELAGLVARLLAEYGWASPADSASCAGVLISSFYPEQLNRSIALQPGLDHGWLLESITEPDLDMAQKLGFRGIYPRAGAVSRQHVAAATDRGLAVRTWGVKDERDLGAAFRSGASGTTVDWPLRARQVLGL